MKKNRKHYSVTQMIWIVVKYVSLVFFSLISVVPIISCVITVNKCYDTSGELAELF